MYRTDKINPLDIQDLENELFYQTNKKEKNIKKELSFLSQIWNTVFASTIHQSLAEAKENYDDLCSKREAEMESIVLHKKCSVPLVNMLWGLVGTVLGMTAVFIGFVLWPTENVFLHPDHWYECMLQCGIVWVGKLGAAGGDVDLESFINIIFQRPVLRSFLPIPLPG
jgi:hypothetical protein